MNCLICKNQIEPFQTLPKRILFTKPVKNPYPDAYGDMDLAYCTQCRHISSQIKTSYSEEELARITYEEIYGGYAPSSLSPTQKAFTEFVANWLRKLLTKPSRVLEIGSHDGYFLSLFQNDGHTCQGVEPSPFADVSVKNYPIPVHKGFFKAGLFDSESFDMVIIRHVVEHLHNPVELVQAAREVLSEDGLIYIEVPYSLESLRTCFFPEFHADHISYFTIPSLKTLFNRAGFSNLLHLESFEAYMKFPFQAALARRSDKAESFSPPAWFQDFKIETFMKRTAEAFSIYMQNLKKLSKYKNLVVWGTGSIGTQYALDAGWGLSDVNYVDINSANQGLKLSVSGHEIFTPEIIKIKNSQAVVIASGWEEDAKKQVQKYLAPGTRVIGFQDLITADGV